MQFLMQRQRKVIKNEGKIWKIYCKPIAKLFEILYTIKSYKKRRKIVRTVALKGVTTGI